MERHYTTEELARFAALREATPAEEIAAVEAGWLALLAEVRAAEGLDPAGPEAAALLERWDALQARTAAHFSGSPELAAAIRRNYAAGAFEGVDGAPQAADFAFMQRVREAQSTP